MIPTPNNPGSFPELTDEQVAWLCGYGKERSLEGGEYLFKEQDYVNSFYVVLEGEIRSSRVAGDGTEDVVTTHPAGLPDSWRLWPARDHAIAPAPWSRAGFWR